MLAWILFGCSFLLPPTTVRISEGGFTLEFRKGVDFKSVDVDASGGLSKGDWVFLDDQAFQLGDPGYWSILVFDDEELVYRVRSRGGGKELISIRLRGPEDLEFLSDTDLRSLRGIELFYWSPELSKRLELLDPHRVVVTVREAAIDPAFPSWLPGGLLSLRVARVTPELAAALPKLESLFVIFGRESRELDASWVSGCRGLRYLGSPGRAVSSLDALAELRSLEVLDLSGCRGFDDVGCLGSLPKLRYLDISATMIERVDARLLQSESLRSLIAQDADLQAIEEWGTTTLTFLDVSGSGLGAKELAAFELANPNCRLWQSWGGSLAHAVRNADRVRVQGPSLEFFSYHDEMRLIFESDRFDEDMLRKVGTGDTSYLYSLSLPDHVVEFYRAGALLTSVELHGGEMRWSGWPYDISLAKHSELEVYRWLAANGAALPLQAALNRGKGDLAEEFLLRTLRQIPIRVHDYADIEDARSLEAFEAVFPGRMERTRVYLRVFGLAQRTWSLRFEFDETVRLGLIPTIEATDLKAILAEDLSDEKLKMGLVRLLFGEDRWSQLDDRDRQIAIERGLVTFALQHPRALNRKETLRHLGGMKDMASLGLLRSVLRGELPPRELLAEERVEPGGWVDPIPSDGSREDRGGIGSSLRRVLVGPPRGLGVCARRSQSPRCVSVRGGGASASVEPETARGSDP